jgi:hypothetical protein
MKGHAILRGEGLYYLRDTRQVVGNCILWWRKGNAGYTCSLDDAAVFTKEVAMRMHEDRVSDVPYPKDIMDSVAYRHVDHQVTDRLESEQQEAAQENIEDTATVAQQPHVETAGT